MKRYIKKLLKEEVENYMFFQNLKTIKHHVDMLLDEPTEEVDVEVDYSEMSPREIQSLIDDALDAGDFDTVGMLSKYL